MSGAGYISIFLGFTQPTHYTTYSGLINLKFLPRSLLTRNMSRAENSKFLILFGVGNFEFKTGNIYNLLEHFEIV